MSVETREIGSLDWRGDPGEDLLIRRAHALDPRSGLDRRCDLLVRAGRIAEITAPGDGELPDGGEEIDAAGLHAFPAFFDPHVHLRTPGQEYREDIETGTRAAAAGGYCGIVAMANTDPVVDDPAIVTALRERAVVEAVVPTGFVATVTRGMEGRELTEMVALRGVGVLGFSDDGLPIADAGVMRRALQYQRLAGGPILLHEEDPALSGDGVMAEGAVSAALGLAGVPDVSESTMIARDGALCLYEGGRAHVQHLSARSSVEAVAAARAAGARLSAELTPHHLTLTDEEVRSLDARFKMNPPLRTEDDRQALIEALRSGVVDCIGTDHAPHAAHEKEVPFEAANMGVTGLETAFAALYTELVLPGVIDLGLLVERMGAGAGLFDLEHARIEVGAEADIALVDLGAEWEAGSDGWESRSANSCFAGRTLRSRPVITVIAGAVAYRRREFTMKVAGVNAKLDPERAALVIVDVQEAFRMAIPDFDRVAAAAATLARGAKEMEVPVLVTEQYPKGLGATVPEVAAALPEGVLPIAKTVFSAAAADGFDLGGREQAIVCGIEAHVCVNQTVLDLLDRGVEVHVVADAVGSRGDADRDLGLAKAERAGAWLTSVETALFELLGTAGSDHFKAVQKLVLEHAP